MQDDIVCWDGVGMCRYNATEIDCSGAWLFWKREAAPALRRSLALHGQMSPVVVDVSAGRPVLVAGFSRVACLAELGRGVVCVTVSGLDEWSKGLAYVHSNAGLDVTDARLVAALRYFDSLHGPENEPWDALDVSARSKQARLARSWLDLPLSWDSLLASGALPLACAEALQLFDPSDYDRLKAVLEPFAWSRGNAVHFLTWVGETCRRETVSLATVLESMGVASLLREDLSPKDAMGRLVHAARGVRYPELSRMEGALREVARRMTAGTRFRLTQPDQFESDEVELSVRLSNGAQLRQAALDLTRIADSADRAGLFSGGEQ